MKPKMINADIIKCLENKSKKILISSELEKLYSITFGREALVKCESTLIDVLFFIHTSTENLLSSNFDKNNEHKVVYMYS